jgi:hypothetical protein
MLNSKEIRGSLKIITPGKRYKKVKTIDIMIYELNFMKINKYD